MKWTLKSFQFSKQFETSVFKIRGTQIVKSLREYFKIWKTPKSETLLFSRALYKEYSICVFHLISPARCNYMKTRSESHTSGRHLIITTFKEYTNAHYPFWRVHECTNTPQPHEILVFPTACLWGPGVRGSSESKPRLMVRHVLSLRVFSIFHNL